MDQKQKDRSITISEVKSLLTEKQLSPQEAAALLDVIETPPSPADWKKFLSIFLAFVGAAFCLSGLLFFFAYNWDALGKFAKLGLLEFCVLVAAVSAWKLGDRIGGQVSVLAAVVLVGPLLAVYGQTYQTGADPYGLFLGWAVLTLPWVILSRMPTLWVHTFVLLNTAFILYWKQVLSRQFDFGDHILPFLLLSFINVIPWVVWEFFHQRGIAWLTARWFPRFFAISSFVPIVMCTSFILIGEYKGGNSLVALAWIGLGALLVGGITYYSTQLPDLFMLAVMAVSVMAVATVGVGQVFFGEMDMDLSGIFLLGLFVVAEVAVVTVWLRKQNQRMQRWGEVT